MFPYNLTLNDALIERARPSFKTQTDIATWMEQQIERMLRQISVDTVSNEKPLRKITVSKLIKTLSNVPASSSDFDYKDDIAELISSKY